MVANTLAPPHLKRGPQREHSPLLVSGIVCGMARGSATMFEAGTLLNETLALLSSGARFDNPRIERRMAKGDGSGISGSNKADKLLLQPAFLKRLNKLELVARSDMPILIEGETGVGKSAIARYLHAHGNRSGGPLIPVNCAAIPDGLLESELFGQVEGAFTGAKKKPGLFELADNGTLFLDEIGDLSLASQAKILEAVQSGELRRVGATNTIQVNVGLIAATNKDLHTLVKRKQFREDLYFRLRQMPIRVPPLRERRDEIEGLSKWFLERRKSKVRRSDIQGFSRDAMALFQAYAWPGNVRELEGVIDKAVSLADPKPLLEAEDFPDLLQRDDEGRGGLPWGLLEGTRAEEDAAVKPKQSGRRLRVRTHSNGSSSDELVQVMKRQWLEALVKAGGSRKKAAELLEMAERTFHHKRNALGITTEEIEAWLRAGGKPKEDEA